MVRMRGVALSALAVIFAAQAAFAADIPNTRAIGTRTTVVPVANTYWNGSAWVAVDGSTARLGDESALQIVGGGVRDTCQIGKSTTNDPTTASGLTVYSVTSGMLWANVTNSTIAAAYPWSVRFWGSRDGVNFAPIMRSTAQTDTLKATYRGPSASTGVWIPLQAANGEPVGLKQIVAVCSNDSAIATVGSRATFVVTIQQRK